jgi:chromosome segregation ATPase
MPEITSIDTIRKKLQEFDERMAGAIEAAGVIARVRTDAELLRSEITALAVKAQQSLNDATAAVQQLQQTGETFQRLKTEAQATQAGLEQTSSRVDHELDKALRSIAEKLCEAEERLRKENQESLSQQRERARHDYERLNAEAQTNQAGLDQIRSRVTDELASAVQSIAQNVREAEERLQRTTAEALSAQAELLKALDEGTRANASTAERAASLADERARQLEQVLCSLQSELHNRISSELSSTEESVKSQLEFLRTQAEDNVLSSTQRLHAEFDRAAQTLADTAGGNEALIRQEIDSFKAEMAKSLSEHGKSMDRQITDFLNKQSALVQNLTQQIDSYHGVSNALSAQLKTATTHLTQLGQFATKVRADATRLAQRLDAQDKIVQALSERLEETNEKLAKKSWLPWGK